MKINQYACISLTNDHQKKGDNPECKDQWILLNKAQCIKNKLREYEPIVGPGKFDSTNTQNAFSNQTPNSSYLFTTIQDNLIVAFKNKLLQYGFIPDLLSAEKFSSCVPQQQYTVSQGDVISLHSTKTILIVRTDKAIVLYKSNNQNFASYKVYNYQGVKQLNIQDNTLFLCLSDKLVIINLIDFTETILKQDNKIVAGFWNQREYYYICEGSETIKSANKQFQIEKPKDITIKSIFVIDHFICVCGYEVKFEPCEDDDDEPATYGAHIYWFDIKCNQPIKEAAHIEVELIAETNNKGDFGILGLCDLQIVYGSNLRKITFWRLGNLVEEAKQFQNSDEKLELLQHSEIRGLTCHQLNPFIGLGMNQRTFRCINRNPNILIMDKKGNISTYEFLDFNKLIEFQEPNNVNASAILNSSKQLLTQSKIVTQRIEYKDIEYTVVESLPKELNKLANPPFNLALQLKNNQSQLVMGEGFIDYKFRLNQNKIPSANLVTQFQHYQILGHEREILIMTPLDIQNILLKQPQSFRRHEITKNPKEIIQGVYTFQNQVLIHTEEAIYFANVIDYQWQSRKVLSFEKTYISRLKVNENYIIIQATEGESQTFVYEFVNNTLQLIAQHQSEAGCYFQLNDQVGLLILLNGYLYFVKDFTTRQSVQLDIKIDESEDYDYFIAQLHNNHIYIGFGKYEEQIFQHFILNFDPVRNLAKPEHHLQNELNENNINDYLVGSLVFADWNITFLETNVSKLIIINPNSIQQGLILQVCGNDLKFVQNENGEPEILPCYSHLVKGISISNYLLPNEIELGSKIGFCKAKKDQKEFQYQMQPSILLFEYDEQSTIQLHRFLLIKLDGTTDTEPLLKVYQEPSPQVLISKPIVQKEKTKPSTTESQMSLQPPPSIPSNQTSRPQQNFMPPTRVAQITQQLVDFCQISMQQLDGQDDQSFFKPYFSMFTPQKFLDECSSLYLQVQNQRRKMIQQTRESSAVNEFCILRKSFNVPKFSITYPKIEGLLKQYATVSEQFSWVCNFVIETLQLNPIRRDRISFGEFNFPSINHIKVKSPNKQKAGRRIAFEEEEEVKPSTKAPQIDKLSYIQKLCYSKKSKVKYFELKTEKREVNDLNIQPIIMSATSFGVNSQRLLQPPQIDAVEEQSEHESDDKVNMLQAKSEIFSKQNNDNKGLVRTKGGLIGQNSENSLLPSKNPFESEDRSKTNSMFGESKSDDNMIQSNFRRITPGPPFETNGNKEEKKQEQSKAIFGNLQNATSNPFGNLAPKKEPEKPAQQKPLSGPEQTNQQKPLIASDQRCLFSTEQRPSGAPEQKPPQAPASKSLFSFEQKPPTEQQPLSAPEQKPVAPLEQKSLTGLEQKPLAAPEQKPPAGSLFTGLFSQTQDKANNPDASTQSFLFGSQPPQQKPKPDGAAQLTSLIPGLSLGTTNQEPTNQEKKKTETGVVTTDSKDIKPPTQPSTNIFANLDPNPSSNIFGFSNTNVQPANLFQSSAAQPTNAFLGIQSDSKQTPKKKEDIQKPEIAPPEKQTVLPQPFISQPKPDQQAVLTSQPLETSQGLGFTGGQQIFGQSQPLQFTNFNQTQGSSLFQQGNTQFSGMQNIGISQPKQGTLNINAASFGTSSSIFDQPNQQATTSQKITFTGLAGQAQNNSLPNSIGGFLGQSGAQAPFLSSTTFNLGFDPAAEKPRK